MTFLVLRHLEEDSNPQRSERQVARAIASAAIDVTHSILADASSLLSALLSAFSIPPPRMNRTEARNCRQ